MFIPEEDDWATAEEPEQWSEEERDEEGYPSGQSGVTFRMYLTPKYGARFRAVTMEQDQLEELVKEQEGTDIALYDPQRKCSHERKRPRSLPRLRQERILMLDHLLDEPSSDEFYDCDGVHPAWDLIGFEGLHGKLVRVVGGRSTYETVVYNDCTEGENVRLAKLVVECDGLRQINRYVGPDTLLEVIDE